MSVMLSNRVLNRDQLAAIGSIAVESTYVEHLLESLICNCCALTKEEKDMLLEGAMLQRKIDLLRDLGVTKLKRSADQNRFREIMSELKAANSDRIMAIHGVWQPVEGMLAAVVHINPSGAALAKPISSRRKTAPLAADKLTAVAQRISNGYLALVEFVKDKKAFHPKRRQKLQKQPVLQ